MFRVSGLEEALHVHRHLLASQAPRSSEGVSSPLSRQNRFRFRDQESSAVRNVDREEASRSKEIRKWIAQRTLSLQL